MTADELIDRLRSRYGSDTAFLTQVPDATGYGKSRTADAIAMGLWPSKGLHLNGFEVKVSRGDWLREIQDPSKAEAFAKHCHYWWIVAAAKVVKLEELPATWGLLEASGDGLKVRRPATIRADVVPPSFEFLASLLRRAEAGDAVEVAAKAAFDRGRKEGQKSMKDCARVEADPRTAIELDRLRSSVKRFRDASGIEIDNYNGERLGEAVKVVQELGLHRVLSESEQIMRHADRIRDACRAAQDAAKGLVERP